MLEVMRDSLNRFLTKCPEYKNQKPAVPIAPLINQELRMPLQDIRDNNKSGQLNLTEEKRS